jgi:hypothetical protein
LVDDELGHILHEARASIRRQEQKALEARRPTFAAQGRAWDRKRVWDFEAGIRDPYLQGIWRGITVGGILWGKARHSMGVVDTLQCEACHEHADSLPQLLWECPSLEPIRNKLGLSKEWAETQPPCLVNHGIHTVREGQEESPSGESHKPCNMALAMQLFLLVAVTLRALRQLNPAALKGGIPLELREELSSVALSHSLPSPFDEA